MTITTNITETHTVLLTVSIGTFSVTGKVIKGINTHTVSVSQRIWRKPGEQVWIEVAQPPTTTF